MVYEKVWREEREDRNVVIIAEIKEKDKRKERQYTERGRKKRRGKRRTERSVFWFFFTQSWV